MEPNGAGVPTNPSGIRAELQRNPMGSMGKRCAMLVCKSVSLSASASASLGEHEFEDEFGLN